MARGRTINLRFPVAGKDTSLSYQHARPFTTVDALNMRPEGTLESRERGGSRGGLFKSFATPSDNALGSGNPLRMLTNMRSTGDPASNVYSELFDSSSGVLSDYTDWTAATWAGVTAAPTVTADGFVQCPLTNGNRYEAVLTDLPINENEVYKVAISVRATPALDSGIDTETNTMQWSLYAKLNSTSSLTQSVRVTLTVDNFFASPYYSIYKLTIEVSGQEKDVSYFHPGVGDYSSGLLAIELHPSGHIEAWYRNTSLLRVNARIKRGDFSGDRIAIGVASSLEGYQPEIDLFYVNYTSTGTPTDILVTSGNGKLYHESTTGSMVEVTSLNDIDNLASDRLLIGADRLGKLYIADHAAVRIERTNDTGTITNGRLDATDVNNWDTGHSIDKEGDLVEVTSIDSGAGEWSSKTSGVYEINNINNTSGLLLQTIGGTVLGSGDNGSTCDFRVIRGPKYFDSSDTSLNFWKADVVSNVPKGTVPLACSIIVLYKDTMVMAGDPDYPGVWYMSRQGDPSDWDYGAVDSQAATAGTAANSDTGQLPLPITALMPRGDDYLIIAAESEMWMLRGHPMQGGTLDNISYVIGVIDRQAWCQLPDGSLLFLGRNGLNLLRPGAQPQPEPLSERVLPVELIDIDTNLYTTLLTYDVARKGVHIMVTPNDPGLGNSFWFDLATRSFWPVLYDPDHQPLVMLYLPRANLTLYGCRDGFIRSHSDGWETDDGTSFTSHVYYGPFKLARGERDGVLLEINAVLAATGGGAAWNVYTGDSAEDALGRPPNAGGTWVAGRSNTSRLRARGHSAFIKVSNSGDNRWAIESLSVTARDGGRTRRKLAVVTS